MTVSVPLWLAIIFPLSCIAAAFLAGSVRAALKTTVAGRLPVVHTHEELDQLIASRHAKGDAARKGWQTRRTK